MTLCPNCGASHWRSVHAVEIELTVLDGKVTWVVADRAAMVGEGDPACGNCGELLLDWGTRPHPDDHESDRLWALHHDARRPAWDQFHSELQELVLPDLDLWSLVDRPGAPA